MHLKRDGEEKYIWKTIGRPEEFTKERLRKIVSGLMRELQQGQKRLRYSGRTGFEVFNLV
ncbi:hypothetical protein [Thermodesulfobacterium sp.]|uniref:hypothetical protein n=1 Tax=Thermodesulfobacterium sp. TaxID=1965289 RepID=UPI0026479A24|nr:hypothetical protein [Thermodesulfobacterium sp.]